MYILKFWMCWPFCRLRVVRRAPSRLLLSLHLLLLLSYMPLWEGPRTIKWVTLLTVWSERHRPFQANGSERSEKRHDASRNKIKTIARLRVATCTSCIYMQFAEQKKPTRKKKQKWKETCYRRQMITLLLLHSTQRCKDQAPDGWNPKDLSLRENPQKK